VKQLLSILVYKKRNVSWAANLNIRLISERSCDTEDWRKDVKNSAFNNRNELRFTNYFK